MMVWQGQLDLWVQTVEMAKMVKLDRQVLKVQLDRVEKPEHLVTVVTLDKWDL